MNLFDFFKRQPSKNEETERLEQQENMLDIIEILSESLILHFPDIQENTLDFSDSLVLITKGDIIITSQALLTVHESLNVKLDYQPLDEYEMFDTIKDVVDYFLARYDYRINIESPSGQE